LQPIFLDYRVWLGINPAFYPMHQRIPETSLRIHKISHGSTGLTGRHERNFDSVVKTTSGDPLQLRTVRLAAPDSRSLAFHTLPFLVRNIETPAGVRHVKPTVRTDERTAKGGCIGVQHPPGEQDFALVGFSVSVYVRILHQVWRFRHIQTALVKC